MTTILALVGAAFAAVVAFFVHRNMASTDNSELDVPIMPPTPPVNPDLPPTAPLPPPQPVDKVKLCASAQQAFEGYWPGSSSYKHKNPGNLKDLSGNFLTFPSYEAGFEALEDYIRRVATGKHRAYPLGGKTTIEQYTHIFTTDPEPSATNYAAAISRATGLSPTDPMSMLLT